MVSHNMCPAFTDQRVVISMLPIKVVHFLVTKMVKFLMIIYTFAV